MGEVDVEQLQRSLTKALERVVTLEDEKAAAERRARNANEARQRAQSAAGRAETRAATAERNLESITQRQSASDASEEELWAHRQMVYMYAVMAVRTTLDLDPTLPTTRSLMRHFATNLRTDLAGQNPPTLDYYRQAYRTAKGNAVGLTGFQKRPDALGPQCHVDECADLFGLYWGEWPVEVDRSSSGE